MKTIVKIETEIEIEIATVKIKVPIRYEDEDIPYDFPLRDGDVWSAEVDIDTGQIRDWPKGKSGNLHMKVCDEGLYGLFDRSGKLIASIQDYVPKPIPGKYGDYIILNIDENGVITNWPKRPDVSCFFRDED